MILAYSGLLYISLLFLEGNTTLKFRGFLYVFTPILLSHTPALTIHCSPVSTHYTGFSPVSWYFEFFFLIFFHMSCNLKYNLIVSTQRCLERKLVKVTWPQPPGAWQSKAAPRSLRAGSPCSLLSALRGPNIKRPFIASSLEPEQSDGQGSQRQVNGSKGDAGLGQTRQLWVRRALRGTSSPSDG